MRVFPKAFLLNRLLPGNQSITGLSFKPSVVLFDGAGVSTDGWEDEPDFIFGAAVSSTSRGAFWIGRNGTAADTDLSTSKVIRHLQAGTPTLLSDADFVSMDSGGFTINWTTADATQRKVGWVAIGPTAAPTFTESAYRWFANNDVDSTDVGAAMAGADTAATLTSDGQQFRLRLLLHVSDDLVANGKNFKLQIATKVGPDCDTNMGTTDESYSDLSPSSGDIRYYDDTDSSKTDGANLTANANDPTHSSDTIRNQDYEEANNFTNTVSEVLTSQDGKWDFSVTDFSAADNTTYCLRVVESDGTLLTTYTVVPEFTTVPENPIMLFGFGALVFGIIKKLRRRKSSFAKTSEDK
ncbi:hypothetical protein HY439_03875 [Candidatus Microgenomates bacterium]|nr:hypothetical protein [Candidatus Microgenomates bacterium]